MKNTLKSLLFGAALVGLAGCGQEKLHEESLSNYEFAQQMQERVSDANPAQVLQELGVDYKLGDIFKEGIPADYTIDIRPTYSPYEGMAVTLRSDSRKFGVYLGNVKREKLEEYLAHHPLAKK